MNYFDSMFLLGRLLYGGFFIRAGINHFRHYKTMAPYASSKGVPMAEYSVVFSGALIFFGGLGVLLGAYPQISLWLIVIFLVPTTFIMHSFWKDNDPGQKMGNNVNFYKNLALLGAAFMLMAFATPWAYSLVK